MDRQRKNNFQRLEEEQVRKYNTSARQDVQNNLVQTFGIFKFIGQLVDVYLPTVIEFFISSAGGNSTSASRHRPPSEGGVHPGKIGPQPPDDVPPRR